MAIISEIKCARCDRKYSGVRSRCPYCGARRIGRGKYSEDGEDNRGKMLIGILILAALTVGAAILLFTTPVEEPDPLAYEPPPENGYNGENDDPTGPDGVTGLEGTLIEDPPEEDPPEEDPPEEPPAPTINSVAITFAGGVVTDFMEGVGDRIPLAVRIDPAAAGQGADIAWSSTEPFIVEIVPDDTSGLTATATHLSRGMSIITVTVTEPDGTVHTAQTYARTR